MALTQVDADKKRSGALGDRVNGFVVIPMGGVTFCSSSAAPGNSGNAMEKGSLCVDRGAGELYIKTSASATSGNATWVKVGVQS